MAGQAGHIWHMHMQTYCSTVFLVFVSCRALVFVLKWYVGKGHAVECTLALGLSAARRVPHGHIHVAWMQSPGMEPVLLLKL